jgi:hypothetical protein
VISTFSFGNLEVDVLTDNNLEVDILIVSDLGVHNLSCSSLEADILSPGGVAWVRQTPERKIQGSSPTMV